MKDVGLNNHVSPVPQRHDITLKSLSTVVWKNLGLIVILHHFQYKPRGDKDTFAVYFRYWHHEAHYNARNFILGQVGHLGNLYKACSGVGLHESVSLFETNEYGRWYQQL